ncbi:ABC transporter ATP-binding protein [[Mycoplasma] mobile]|uniref:Maltodextrin ABC transporter ATP-binding protein n=1 Tax=Mycoplasma mobile (strain ATCC 43663 / 163K / NCTC 11711) TaxID=267748 RepID=Q6KHQ5_MYCM1|nr:ABC transporter ATP-binding protein [[Mycoplasma] mobile]AAT27873.1 maltodextrin ABC transporter ATP-binding protein [Mycoplasma mobile 163K]
MKIELRNIAKKYEGRENYTLENINLSIDDNDFLIILGPSGCGKSTLLRMIAGLNSITKGDLVFDGIRVNGLSPKDRDIAMVFQSYALYPHMTVYQNIAFGLKVRKERKDVIDRRVKDIAKILQISEYLSNKPSDISGGQRQRVALGRAIARKPKLFLMDEPLSNLDAKLRESMRIELVRIHRLLESTTIYVTHDQLEAMTMGTKIVVMNNSKIQQIGKPLDLYNKPVNLFVAKFIGNPTINVFEGSYENGYFISESGILKIKLNDSDNEKIQIKGSKKITLCVRSEDIYLTKENNEDKIIAKSEFVEILGKEKQAFFVIDGKHSFVASLHSSANIQVEKNYTFTFDKNKLHIFDTASTNRIN